MTTKKGYQTENKFMFIFDLQKKLFLELFLLDFTVNFFKVYVKKENVDFLHIKIGGETVMGYTFRVGYPRRSDCMPITAKLIFF